MLYLSPILTVKLLLVLSVMTLLSCVHIPPEQQNLGNSIPGNNSIETLEAIDSTLNFLATSPNDTDQSRSKVKIQYRSETTPVKSFNSFEDIAFNGLSLDSAVEHKEILVTPVTPTIVPDKILGTPTLTIRERTAPGMVARFNMQTIEARNHWRGVEDDALNHFDAGDNYYESGFYEKAIDSYSSAMDEATIAYNRGIADNKKWPYELNRLREILVWSYYRRAITFREMNQFNNAISDLTLAIQTLGSGYGNWPYLGVFDNSLTIVDLLIKRSVIYSRYMDEPQKALDDIDQLLSIHPDNSRALAQKGMVYIEAKHYQMGLDYLDKAASLGFWNEEEEWIHYYRGIAYLELGQLWEDDDVLRLSISEATQSIALIDWDSGGLKVASNKSNMAEAHFYLGEFFTALEIIAEIEGGDESFNRKFLLDLKADSLYEMAKEFGTWELVLEPYTELIKLDPDNWGLHGNRGMVYTQIGSEINAFEDYNKAIELGANFAGYYWNRGIIYEGYFYNVQAANMDYRKACELDPNIDSTCGSY